MEKKPLVLEKRHPDRVLLMNALASGPGRWAFPIGGRRCAVRLSAALPAFEKRATVRIEVNGRPFELALGSVDWLAAHPLFDDPAMKGAMPEACPEALQGALAEALLTPLFEEAAKRLGVEVAFADYAESRGERCFASSVGFMAEFEGGARPIPALALAIAPLSAEAAREGERLLRGLSQEAEGKEGEADARFDALPLRLSVCGAEVRLPVSDYDALAAGDVVLLARWLLESQEVLLIVESAGREVKRFRGAFAEGSITLGEVSLEEKEESMAQSDELTVSLTFELESRTITLADLKRLAPGYAFRLGTDPSAPVTVRANGRAVARGRLVDLGGSLGVELADKPALEAPGEKDGL